MDMTNNTRRSALRKLLGLAAAPVAVAIVPKADHLTRADAKRAYTTLLRRQEYRDGVIGTASDPGFRRIPHDQNP